jgi:hypothetical protein
VKPKKEDLTEFLELKVYRNRRTGQGIVMLPKKIFGNDVKKVRIGRNKIW